MNLRFHNEQSPLHNHRDTQLQKKTPFSLSKAEVHAVGHREQFIPEMPLGQCVQGLK